ncbi:MAG: hypothetical protein NTY74_11305 [Ignavibacteriae bacterium]|nr:hypothetical protein [Ignavibacteriota bacterium]
MDIESNSLIVKLKDVDKRKIFRILKKLKTNLSIEFIDIDMEMISFDIFIGDYASIKIINNQLYVTRDDIHEFLIDENNLVRDIVLDKATRKNYDDMRKIMQLIYPYNRMKRKKAKEPFTLRNKRYITPLLRNF